MGQTMPARPVALVVENEPMQRDLLATLLEESNMSVVECDTAEAAKLALDQFQDAVWFLFAEARPTGQMDGVELARLAKQRHPHVRVVISSGDQRPDLPPDTHFMQKPWTPLDVLVQAEKSLSAHGA